MFQISSLVFPGRRTARRTLSEWSWSLLTPAVAAMNLESLVTSCLERALGAMVEDIRTRNSGTRLRGVESSSSVLNTQTYRVIVLIVINSLITPSAHLLTVVAGHHDLGVRGVHAQGVAVHSAGPLII